FNASPSPASGAAIVTRTNDALQRSLCGDRGYIFAQAADHLRAVRDDVIDRRVFRPHRHEFTFLLGCEVAFDVEHHANLAIAVATFLGDAEQAAQVEITFEARAHRIDFHTARSSVIDDASDEA